MRKLFAALAAFVAVSASAATLSPIQLLNPVGSTSGQTIVSTGATTAPAWSKVPVSGLATQAANTVLANATATLASPTAIALPSCSTSSSALQWTSNTGFSCITGYAPLASPSFTGTETITDASANNTGTLAISATSSTSGVNIKLTGNGGTTPIKTIRSFNGNFQVLNNAYSTAILSVDDSGNATFPGSVTPSQTAGIIGTTTNNNANAGSVGEVVSSIVPSGSAVSLTTNVTANITSISLSAGDWIVWGVVRELPAGTTTTQNIQGGVSTTSATLGTQAAVPGQGFYLPLAFAAGVGPQLPTGMTRLSFASTTTVYLVTQVGFSVSTCAAYGELIAWRRR